MGLGGLPAGHWLVPEITDAIENQSAGGMLFQEVCSGECDKTWNTFNCQDNLESWRHDSLGRAGRGARQMGLCLEPQRIERLRSHFFTSVLSSLRITLPCFPSPRCQVFSLIKHCIFTSFSSRPHTATGV